ncbi:hypothetical protein NDU88_006343 [Pleurodeles waltl]|uniref:RAD9, HUS1, RAD1-interacting nuclear orphan protein 1 n=1 Tax=Pleurodeles waltl TaxID=8319 RepID=A0AAV7SPJ2_PLEWA|nr:hypothetical protein NDU88_006343 [Pleurodeles waltl]
MPRRKKSSCNPRKPQLPFLENPLHGPIHQYGSPLQKAENPRYVPAKPLDQSTSTSWVSPQFDHTVDLHFPGRRRRHISNSTLDVPVRTRKTNRTLLNASKACRRPSVCKFPPLDFKDISGIPSDPTDSLFELRPLGRHNEIEKCNPARGNDPVLVTKTRPRNHLVQAAPLPSLLEIENDDGSAADTLSPPEVATPEPTPLLRRSSIQLRRVLLPPKHSSEGGSPTQFSRRAITLCCDSELDRSCGTPEGLTPFPVLVQDTPEHEYGVRITWRRRREFMKYLKDRGKLKSSEILVKRGPLSSLPSN